MGWGGRSWGRRSEHVMSCTRQGCANAACLPGPVQHSPRSTPGLQPRPAAPLACPLVCPPAPMPIVGMSTSRVTAAATRAGTHSSTREKQPAASSALASFTTRSASEAAGREHTGGQLGGLGLRRVAMLGHAQGRVHAADLHSREHCCCAAATRTSFAVAGLHQTLVFPALPTHQTAPRGGSLPAQRWTEG